MEAGGFLPFSSVIFKFVLIWLGAEGNISHLGKSSSGNIDEGSSNSPLEILTVTVMMKTTQRNKKYLSKLQKPCLPAVFNDRSTGRFHPVY